jgi:hypothetical protein
MKVITAVVILTLVGCVRGSFMERYKMAVKSGFKKIPEARQIEDLLGEADHFISYSGPNVPQDWNTVVRFGGRYELAMQVVVETSFDFSEVTKVKGEPRFYFYEVSRIVHYPNGKFGCYYNGASERHFGRAEWRKVVAAKADFSVIGIRLKRGPSVPDFEKFVRAVRRDAVRVSPYDSDDNAGAKSDEEGRNGGVERQQK